MHPQVGTRAEKVRKRARFRRQVLAKPLAAIDVSVIGDMPTVLHVTITALGSFRRSF